MTTNTDRIETVIEACPNRQYRKLANSQLKALVHENANLTTLLTEVYHDLKQRAMPNADDEWFEKTRKALGIEPT